mgnify:CR=1 FL=1
MTQITEGSIKRKCSDNVDKEKCKFWISLLEKSDRKTDLFNNVITISKSTGPETGIGKSGVRLGYIGNRDKTWVQLCINSPGNIEKTKKMYEDLLAKSWEIDKKYPELKIVWKPIEKDPTNSRLILSYSNKGYVADKDKWDEIQDDLVDRMVKFEKIFKDWILEYKG